MEEVREPSVRQGCLKSPRSPQITLHPCFYFSPSYNKSSQMFGLFFIVSVPVAACLVPAQILGSLRPSWGSVLCGFPPQARVCSSSLCSFPGQDLSWPWLLALLSVEASQHALLCGPLLPHRLFCYPAVELSWPVRSLPLSLPPGNTFSGTAYPLSPSLLRPWEFLQFFLFAL